MSSSAETTISIVMEEIRTRHPNSVLDIGIGFGKWGFLCREYLESWRNRTYPEQWIIKIDGIEIWKPFVEKLPWNKIMYNHIYIGDVYEIIDRVSNYDLIIAGDVVEHLTKEKGIRLIEKMIRLSKCLLVSVPIGKCWLNNSVVDNNPYEKHQAVWEVADLIKLGKEQLGCDIRIRMWKGVRGDGCVAVFEKK